MARPRRPVQSLQESLAPRLAPQAAPVQFNPTVRQPDDLPIYDFAAISGTIAGYLRKQQEARDVQQQQVGEQFAEQHRLFMADLQEKMAGAKTPEERDRLQKQAFGMLRKLGEIPDMADPNVRIGLERANGRILAGQYWQNLQRRLPEVSLAVDPRTGLPALPADAERVMAEEWERISQAPAVQGFYGGQEALATKQRADDQFLQQVTQRRSAAEKEHYDQALAQEWGQAFDAIVNNTDAVSSKELAPLTALVEQEVQAHNLLNPRELVLNALELSIRRASAIDSDHGLKVAHAAQDLVIGGVRLGDDRSGVGDRLNELIRQARQDAKDKDELELRQEDVKQRLAAQKAEADFLPKLLQAKREGQSLRGVADQLEKQYLADDQASGRFGGRGAFAVRALHDAVTQMERDVADDPAAASAISNLIADGHTDQARALVNSASANGSLSGETRLRVTQAIEARENVGRFLEDDNLYNEVKARYNQAAPKGFATEVQERFDAETLDMQRRLERDYAEQVRATQGNPQQQQILRDWLGKREEADNTQRAQQAAGLRERRDAVFKEVTERAARMQDSEDAIAQAERDGSVTVGEAEKLRGENRDSGKAKDNLQFTAEREAMDAFDSQFTAALGGQPPTNDQLTQREAARRKLRDRLGLEIDAMVADKANDPRSFVARARAISDKVVDEVGGELVKGLNPSESVDPTLNASALADRLRDPLDREQFQATDPVFAAGEGTLFTAGVPKRFYEYAAAWWSGRDPIFGDPVNRGTVMAQVSDLYNANRLNPQRDAIVAGAMDVTGLDALDVLKGVARLEPSDEAIVAIQNRIDFLQAASSDLLPPESDARILALQRLLEPVQVSLQGHQYKPYLTAFFRSREAFNAFSNDPAYPDFLRKIGVNPDDAKAVAEWAHWQTVAIDRSKQ